MAKKKEFSRKQQLELILAALDFPAELDGVVLDNVLYRPVQFSVLKIIVKRLLIES